MGFVIFCRLATITKRGTNVPPNRSEWQELVEKRSRSLFNLFGRWWFRSGDVLRLSKSKSAAADCPGVQAGFAPRKSAMLEVLQSKAHVGRGVVWVLQTCVKGPGLPFDLSWYQQLRIPWAKFFRKIQFPRSVGRGLDHKLAAGALFGKRITAPA